MVVIDEVIEKIKVMIVLGEFVFGDCFFLEKELLEWFGLFCNFMCEVVKVLEVIWVFDVCCGDGIYVMSFELYFLFEVILFVVDMYDDDFMFEIFVVCCMFEFQVIGLVVMLGSDEEIMVLQDEVSGIDVLVSIEEFVEYDICFYWEIVVMVGNVYFVSLIEYLSSQMVWVCVWWGFIEGGVVDCILLEYCVIVDVIVQYDLVLVILFVMVYIVGVEWWFCQVVIV